MTYIRYFFISIHIDNTLKTCFEIIDEGYFKTTEEAIEKFKKRNKLDKKHGYSVAKEVEYYV